MLIKINIMPKRKMKSHLKGRGFFEDIGNFVNDGLKSSKILSTGTKWAGGVIGGLLGPEGIIPGAIVGEAVGNVLRDKGYGGRMKGAGSMLHDNRIIKGAGSYNINSISQVGMGHTVKYHRIVGGSLKPKIKG